MIRLTCLSSLILPLAAAALTAPVLAQTTWYVDAAAPGPGSGTSVDPYPAIQAAIDAPLTLSGDTLLISGGIYQESIDLVGKSLRLTGADAATGSPTEIWGAPAAGVRVVTINSGETLDTTFTSIDIVDVFSPINQMSGGVLLDGAASRFIDCEFRLCGTCGPGGAIRAQNSDVVVTGCAFLDNGATSGGAISVSQGSLVARDCLFEGNTSAGSAGCNNSQGRGGAVATQTLSLEISDCFFLNNVGGDGGALHIESAIGGEIFTRNVFEGNGPSYISTGFEGGAINAPTNALITDSVFRRNAAGRGGAVAGGHYERCQFEANAAEYGGGAYLATLTECFFVGNEARTFGGNVGAGGATHSCQHVLSVLYGNHCAGGAGGSDNTMSLDRCTVIGNSGDFRFAGFRGNQISNSIVWGNVSTVPASSVTQADYQSATFSMIQGVASSIPGPPLLFGRHVGDARLLPASPAIDAANPGLPTDPDGSRADVGARAFDPSARPESAERFCEPKISAMGCTPNVQPIGAPAFSGAPMVLLVEGVPSGSAGILLLSSTAKATPFFGGTLCVGGSIVRAGLAGAIPTAGCGDALVFSIGSSELATVGSAPGEFLFGQVWFRDAAHPDGTGVGVSEAFVATVGL